MKTKAELVQEYLDMTDSRDIENLKTAMFAEMVGFPQEHEKKVRLWFDREIEVATETVRKLMLDAFDVEELTYLIEARNHPAAQKVNALMPKLMGGMAERIQATCAMFEDLLRDPKKIESLPS